jgi:hypothetical protein
MILSLIRQHPRLAAAIGLVLVLIAGGLAGGIFLLSRSYAAPPQPLVYQHQKHVAAGASCLYCHAGATRGAVAGLPSLSKCMGCHTSVNPKDPADQKDIDLLVQYWENKQPVQWIKINDQPDFVHFNHRPHVAAGVACETCHGNVSQVAIPQAYNHNMGWCLDCHRQQAPEKITRLIDCATCHY